MISYCMLPLRETPMIKQVVQNKLSLLQKNILQETQTLQLFTLTDNKDRKHLQKLLEM